MDLLGDIGNADQLTSARAENAVLTKKVKELEQKVKHLTVENEVLKAEVEMYRAEAALPSFSKLALGESKSTDAMDEDRVAHAPDEFVVSGNGIFPTDPAVSLSNLHGTSNPLCCALHPNDTLLATGGADSHLSLCEWGGALAPTSSAAADTVKKAARISCGAPVICAAFAQANNGSALPVVAAGCMDGSVKLAGYGRGLNGSMGIGAKLLTPTSNQSIKHGKYVRCLSWSPSAPVLATASADGTIQLTKFGSPNESGLVEMEKVQTFHLPGPVEAMCFLGDGNTLCCYVRGTPYLSCFDLRDGCKQTKINLNNNGTTGGFDDHVSFAVMNLSPSPMDEGKYLAAATDTSRNIILEARTGRQIRNLYGHKNDGYSQPKIAWSSSGQYLFGNTQDEGTICIWDIASSTIVKTLDSSCGGHSGQVRDLYSSRMSDTVVSASYDKTTKVWLRGM